MDYERRIKQLEKELTEVKQLLRSSGLIDDFIPVAKAAQQLDQNPWVIKSIIKSGRVEYGKHYKKNGNRYLINVDNWRRFIISVEQAKHR